jgi:hypothetical protein
MKHETLRRERTRLRVASLDAWALWWRADGWVWSSKREEWWMTLRMANDDSPTFGHCRKIYTLGWNGRRFSNVHDLELLRRRFPADLVRIQGVLRQALPQPAYDGAGIVIEQISNKETVQ